MLQFLEPIWLYAMAAIAAPVIIHLWNNRHGKKLKIGSIVFLEENSVQRTKRNFISEWLLLLIRCLLIILLAFLLTQPFLKKNENANAQKGWLIIDKRDATETYNHFKPTIDSLLQKGYELHSFNKDFEKIAIEDISKKENNNADSIIPQYRLLYQKLDQFAPASIPIYIFSSNELIRYKGEIPVTSRNIKWLSYTKPDSESIWIDNAYLAQSDSIYLTKAISKPSGTRFIHQQIENTPGKKSGYDVTLANGSVGVSIDKEKVLTVDTSTFKITIYTDHLENDAEYLKAAIGSIQKFTQRKIRLSMTESLQNVTEKQDWVFWLSDEKMPMNILSSNLFQYNKGKAIAANSWIDLNNQNLQTKKISIAKYVGSTEQYQSPEMIWKDGFGKPILLAEKNDDKMSYHFYSHFDPAWNGLVWSNSFPSLLMNLFFKDDKLNENDKCIIDAKQIQPKFELGKNNNASKNYSENINLNSFLWFFVFLVFFIERIVSFKTKNGALNVR